MTIKTNSRVRLIYQPHQIGTVLEVFADGSEARVDWDSGGKTELSGGVYWCRLTYLELEDQCQENIQDQEPRSVQTVKEKKPSPVHFAKGAQQKTTPPTASTVTAKARSFARPVAVQASFL